MRPIFLSVTFLATAALCAGACRDSLKDCENTLTCSSDDGDLGGAPGDGGNAGDGDGDGDGGSSSGGTAPDPCDECTGDTPACNADEECVECTTEDDSACEGETPLCDTAAESCVGCLENTDCTDANAALCDGGTCAGCTGDDDCSHIADLNACDTDSSTCVECTDSSDCGGNPCNPVTHTCSAFGTDRRTCESCDTDENCDTADNFCVPMQYDGADRETGYCLKKTPTCTEPFLSPLNGRATLSGVEGQTYCGINEALATCEAVRALLDNLPCPGGEDSECPESGLCRTLGGDVAPNRCTYECDGVTDCKETGLGSTCGDAPNDFCGYAP